MPPEDKKYFYIGSMEEGLNVLQLLVNSEEMSVSQAAAKLGINRSASHRFLATLRETGYRVKMPAEKISIDFQRGLRIAFHTFWKTRSRK